MPYRRDYIAPTRPRPRLCCVGWLIAVGTTVILFGGLAFLVWLSHRLAS